MLYHTESAFRFQVRMTTLDKPLRADARRNREKILVAARAVFAEQGVDAQMDDVARKADVGVGTVYRHFPTKEALLNALTDELFAVIAVHTRTLLTLEDPWEAFTRALWFGAEKTAGDRAFTEIMAAQQKWPARSCPGKEDLLITIGDLMERCKAAGSDAAGRHGRGHRPADVRRRQRQPDGAHGAGRLAPAPRDHARRPPRAGRQRISSHLNYPARL